MIADAEIPSASSWRRETLAACSSAIAAIAAAALGSGGVTKGEAVGMAGSIPSGRGAVKRPSREPAPGVG